MTHITFIHYKLRVITVAKENLIICKSHSQTYWSMSKSFDKQIEDNFDNSCGDTEYINYGDRMQPCSIFFISFFFLTLNDK